MSNIITAKQISKFNYKQRKEENSSDAVKHPESVPYAT